MLSIFQKHTPAISTLLLIALLAVLFFYPASSRVLSIVIIVFGISMAIVFTMRGNLESHKNGEITRQEFFRNTALDLLGLGLTMGAAMWLGRLAGGKARQVVAYDAATDTIFFTDSSAEFHISKSGSEILPKDRVQSLPWQEFSVDWDRPISLPFVESLQSEMIAYHPKP